MRRKEITVLVDVPRASMDVEDKPIRLVAQVDGSRIKNDADLLAAVRQAVFLWQERSADARNMLDAEDSLYLVTLLEMLAGINLFRSDIGGMHYVPDREILESCLSSVGVYTLAEQEEVASLAWTTETNLLLAMDKKT